MRKTLLALLVSSLAASLSTTSAQQLQADAANFEPARKVGDSSTEPTPTSPGQPAAAPSTASPDVAQAALEELIRRQAAQVTGRALLDEGQKLYYDGKYEQAAAKLEEAVKTIPRAKATEVDYNRALHALTDSYYRLGNSAYQAGNYKKARDYARKALEYDPKNRSAENLLVSIKRAESGAREASPQAAAAEKATPPNKTPEFQAKRTEIRHLFREGKILMNSGQFDDAEKRFQQILLVDPYNTDAYELLNRVNQLRSPSTTEGTEASRTRMLWQADNAWVRPISGEVLEPKLGGGGYPLGVGSAASVALHKKLNDIVFPEIKFREAAISDVVAFLHDESVKIDPTHDGINIVLGTGVSTGEAPSPAADGPEGVPAATPALTGVGSTRPITLSLRNVPMIEALRYITTLANLKYRIESSAVMILTADAPEGEMITRSYPVNPNVFLSLVSITNYPASTQRTQTAGGGGGGAAQVTALSQAGPSFVLPDVAIAVELSNQVRQLFVDSGVQFPTNSSIYYFPRNSTIIIHNTVENIETFERVLAILNTPPQLVEIETKFVEISQGDLDELGFNWKVGSFNSGDFRTEGGSPGTIFPSPTIPDPNNSDAISGGLRDSTILSGNAIDALLAGSGASSGLGALNQLGTIKGILTNPRFEVVIKALAQKKSADLLSAPKVTTISGAQAQIRVAQEFIYPTAFTTPTAVSSAGNVGGAGTAVTPSTPSAFASRPVGVVFNVTPTVGADGYTIGLTLIPQVTDFLGFIEYGNNIALSSGGPVTTTFNSIKQPLFAVRDVMTSVIVWDGQTVVLGGLIREDVQKIDDKIPFLGDIPIVGRLFRSKVTSRTKRNLLIFVTARLIDPAGNPIHKEDVRASVH